MKHQPNVVSGVAVLLLGTGCCGAATVVVTVMDRDAKPVPGVAVVATSLAVASTSAARAEVPQLATMDQIKRQFEPQVLVVRKGTTVSFPNSDDVAHQVYSFSPPKRFALPLYRGQASAPVTFDQPGIVILGCNIHDSMIGYIYVADSEHYGKTDAAGHIELTGMADGAYRVTAWNPRFTEANPELTQEVAVRSEGASVTFKLTRAMVPPPAPAGTRKLRY